MENFGRGESRVLIGAFIVEKDDQHLKRES